MQINDAALGGLTSGAASGAGRAEAVDSVSLKTKQGGASKSTGSDAISLSSLAQQVNDLDADSSARAAKVEQLRADYQSGRYQVDAQELASKLIDDSIAG